MNLHEGHRQRMYEKAQEDKLLDHEWLEVLLFPLQPRKNTNDLAHRLLAYFGSIEKVYSASIADLQRVPGVGPQIATHLNTIGRFIRREVENRQKERPEIYEHDDFLVFVNQEYKQMTSEVCDVFLLDAEGKIFNRHRFTDDSLCNVQLAPEELAHLILKEETSGIVIVHNHPFGKARPSDHDNLMTQNCQLICSVHNVLLCDHVIYSPEGVYSYYKTGELQKIMEQNSVYGMLNGEIVK